MKLDEVKGCLSRDRPALLPFASRVNCEARRGPSLPRQTIFRFLNPFAVAKFSGRCFSRNRSAKFHQPRLQPGLFTMRGRRHGESLFHWDTVPSLWFRQVTHDVKLTNLQNLPPRQETNFKGQTRRLSS